MERLKVAGLKLSDFSLIVAEHVLFRTTVLPLNVGQVIFMLYWFLDIWCWRDVAVQ